MLTCFKTWANVVQLLAAFFTVHFLCTLFCLYNVGGGTEPSTSSPELPAPGKFCPDYVSKHDTPLACMARLICWAKRVCSSDLGIGKYHVCSVVSRCISSVLPVSTTHMTGWFTFAFVGYDHGHRIEECHVNLFQHYLLPQNDQDIVKVISFVFSEVEITVCCQCPPPPPPPLVCLLSHCSVATTSL